MVAAVPLMLLSIGLARYRGDYVWHKRLQLTLGAVLLLMVAGFEIEMRTHGWQDLARPSRYWVEGRWNDLVEYSLAIHLLFAIPTPILWGVVIVAGLRQFPRPPAPNRHSLFHRTWGRRAAWALIGTALTGWWFYWCAFAA